MPATELVSHSSELINYVTSLKRRFSSCSTLLKDALMFLNRAVFLTPYDSSSDGDVESGAKGKTVHPGMLRDRLCKLVDQNEFFLAMWYSFTYIMCQLFPVDSSLFGEVSYYFMDHALSESVSHKHFNHPRLALTITHPTYHVKLELTAPCTVILLSTLVK